MPPSVNPKWEYELSKKFHRIPKYQNNINLSAEYYGTSF